MKSMPCTHRAGEGPPGSMRNRVRPRPTRPPALSRGASITSMRAPPPRIPPGRTPALSASAAIIIPARRSARPAERAASVSTDTANGFFNATGQPRSRLKQPSRPRAAGGGPQGTPPRAARAGHRGRIHAERRGTLPAASRPAYFCPNQPTRWPARSRSPAPSLSATRAGPPPPPPSRGGGALSIHVSAPRLAWLPAQHRACALDDVPAAVAHEVVQDDPHFSLFDFDDVILLYSLLPTHVGHAALGHTFGAKAWRYSAWPAA